MSGLVAVFAVVLVCVVSGAKNAEKPKTLERLLAADVLRDFPTMCFASTKCATIEPGQSWDLTPFCGRSTCVLAKDTGKLLEKIEDCGAIPKENPKCKDTTNKTAPYPGCCPTFECQPGAKIEYHPLPTAAPAPGKKNRG